MISPHSRDRAPAYRGSRKHILDWTSRATFPNEFLELVNLEGFTLTHTSIWKPRGYTEPDEACLEDCGARLLPGTNYWDKLATWWLAHRRGANKPNWDLVVSGTFQGTPALVLVEAKAHEQELDWNGKPLKPGATVSSVGNHEHIGKAIEEARVALDRIIPRVRISRDRHYQLSNRVAYSWKLASMGVPIILVYLGFIGDKGIADIGPPFRDHAHWQTVMQNYVRNVLPDELFDCWIDCGSSKMQIVVRSRGVIEQSPKERGQ